jgi:hypothetical protein
MLSPEDSINRETHQVEQGDFNSAIQRIAAAPTAAETAARSRDEQEREKFATLLGKEPDKVESYFSSAGNLQYYACSITTQGNSDVATKIETWTLARFEVWTYQKDAASGEMREVWHEGQLWRDMERGWSLAGFVNVAGQTAPCLRLTASSSGMHADTARLGLYCVNGRRPLWVDYNTDYGPSVETGVQKVRVIDDNAPEPNIRQYLFSWGHQMGLDVPPSFPAIDSVRRIQQLWIDANGSRACPSEWTASSIAEWRTQQVDHLAPYISRKLLKDPEIILESARYQWLSYPGAHAMADVGTGLAGIGRYDKQLDRYALIYVPYSTFDYSKQLVMIGDYLYVQDCQHWAVRLNTVTQRLERGDYDEVVGSLKNVESPRRAPNITDGA